MGVLDSIDRGLGRPVDKEKNAEILGKIKFKKFEELSDKDFIGDEQAKKFEEQKEAEKKRYDSNISIIDPEGKKIKTEEDGKFSRAIQMFMDKIHLAEQFISIIPTYYDESGLWWIWNFQERKWELKDDVEILNKVGNASGANIVSSKERTEIINALKQVGRKNKPEELEPHWLQFKDQIVDLKTGDKFEATPRYFVTNPIPWKLGRSDDTPTMDKIFEEWVGKKYVKTLYEIIAFCMIPDYPIHRLFCFHGSGLNGKSCYLKLLKKFIGSNNVCATELDVLLKSRFEITRLHRKLVCQMGETNFGEISKTSILKKLTGQDTIGFEYKNKTPFEAINYAKIIIATNSLPPTTDKTPGFYRRWMIIDFPNTFSEKSDILGDIPDEEYENLAMKSVGVLIDLLKKREFHEEGTIEERMEKYEAKSNFLEKFIEDFVVEDPNGYITVNDFFIKFKEWCKEHRHRDMAKQSVSKEMKRMHYEHGKKYFDWLHDGKGGDARVWLGIKWKV